MFLVFRESFLILLAMVFILLATISWGRRLRLFFPIEPPNAWLQWGTEFGLGILFWELLWLGSGLARIWFKPFFIAVAILLSAIVLLDMIQLVIGAARYLPKTFPRDPSYLFLFLMGAVYLFFSIAHGLVPETFYDSMVYHLAVPQYWLLHHGICDFPTNFFSNFPFGGEALLFKRFRFSRNGIGQDASCGGLWFLRPFCGGMG